MTRPTTLFRLAIVGSIVLGACSAVVDIAFPSLVPEALRNAEEAIANPGLQLQDYLLIGIGVPILISLIACAFGLYTFHRWAPRVSVYVTVGSLLLYLLLDGGVYSPWSALLSEASSILWGVVLAMAFLPPVSARFQELHANNPMQPTGQTRPAADWER